jgi:catechol 1,2-dioxygenase
MKMIKTYKDVTPAVLKVMQATPDPRLRDIMVSLVTHLHGFITETRLTEVEFREATALLNEIGALASDTHNEFVLMAGSLGVSSLVCLLNNGENGATETSQNLLGPFWRMHSPRVENGGTIVRSNTFGERLEVKMQVLDETGNPLEGAEVDIWQANGEGLYENQDDSQEDMNLRGKFASDAQGFIQFSTVKPKGYSIPDNGVVGRLLKAQGRHPLRPAHLHALVFKEGYKTLISQIYPNDDENLETDVQFGVTKALTAQFKNGRLDYVFKMEKGEAVLPRPPIK